MSEILSRQPLFRGLSEPELDLIAEHTREYRVNKNEFLFQKGDIPHGMHVLVMGQVKLSIPSFQGSEKVVHMLGPGNTFGEAVLFLDKTYPVSAQATQDGLVLLVQKDGLLQAIDQNPMLARKMLAGLSLRLHELMDDIESCSLRNSTQRVIAYILQQMPATAQPPHQITLGTSKQTLAAQLNLAPETLSRTLGQLSQKGLIEVQGRDITILDREGLLAALG